MQYIIYIYIYMYIHMPKPCHRHEREKKILLESPVAYCNVRSAPRERSISPPL